MNPTIIAALIQTTGSIIVVVINKKLETNSQSNQERQESSSPPPDSPQPNPINNIPSRRSLVERGAGTFFLIAWVAACTAGWTMGWLIGWLIGVLLGGTDPTLSNVISGLIIGVAQWYILQNKLRKSKWWILATASSGIGAGFIFSALGYAGYTLIGIIFANIAAGLFAGIAQWLILKRQISDSGQWVVITTVAWTLGGTIGNIFASSSGNFAIGGLACGLVMGFITGSQLTLLLNRSH